MPSRWTQVAAIVLLATVGGGTSCIDRIQPATSCEDDSECSAGEECVAGECVAGSTLEPDNAPEPSAEPSVTPEPGAQPAVEPAVAEPEGEPEADVAIVEPDAALACQDLAEANAEDWGVEHPFEDLDAFIDNNSTVGTSAVAIRTSLAQPARLIYPKRRDRSVDASAYKSLVLSLKGISSNAVFAPPVVILEDCDGNTKRFVSVRPLGSGDAWKRFAVPLGASNNAWNATGTVDVSRLRGVMIEVNAQGGYDLSVDDIGFVPLDGGACPTTCPDCGGRGVCEIRQGLPGCACECMDLSEGNSTEWGSYFSPDHAAAVTTTLTADASDARVGNSSISASTDASLDWAVVYPGTQSVIWDLSQTNAVSFWSRGENANVPQWQGSFPAVILRDDFGGVLTLTPDENRLSETWTHHLVPLIGGNGWNATGGITSTHVRQIEFHADTWEDSFEFWIDGVAFRQSNDVCLETCLSTCVTGTCQDLRGMPTCL